MPNNTKTDEFSEKFQTANGEGGNFLGRICLILGGLDPCPNGFGHFFSEISAPDCQFECGGGGGWCNRYLGNAQMPSLAISMGLP